MKRRAFLATLLGVGATLAIADPTQAQERRRRRRSRRSGYRSRTSYQSVSYSGTAPTRQEPPQAVDPYAETRSDSGVLDEKQVYRFQELYNQQQSRKAMRSALGEPAEHYWDRDVWKIRRIGIDGNPSGKFGKFEARYRWGDQGGWTGKTATPPTPHW